MNREKSFMERIRPFSNEANRRFQKDLEMCYKYYSSNQAEERARNRARDLRNYLSPSAEDHTIRLEVPYGVGKGFGHSHTKARLSTYIGGIDAYRGSGNPFPTKEIMEQLNKVNKMRTKKFYHTFEFKDRTVTLCMLVQEKPRSIFNVMPSADMVVGYSVCHPDDEFDDTLAKKIALGRAEKQSANIEEFAYGLPKELAFDLALLKGFALRFERLITRGEVIIKGIKDVE